MVSNLSKLYDIIIETQKLAISSLKYSAAI